MYKTNSIPKLFRDDYEIKMSMGVSLYDATTSVEELLNRADQVLYQAKREGKAEKNE